MTEAVEATTEPVEPVETPIETPAEPVLSAPAAEPAAEPEIKGDWREDWREALAAGVTGKTEGDEFEKEMKRLKRFTSLPNVLRSYRALETRISSGELKEPFPSDGTPEQQTKWREANGIPASPDKYDLSLPEGLTVGEEDRPIVDEVLKAAHSVNAPPSVVKSMVSAYYAAQDNILAQRAEQDHAFLEETQEVLRAEFGPEYRHNIEATKAFLSTLPDGLGDRLAGARLADGRPLGADPVAARWLVELARELNPIASLMPGGTGDIKGIDDELREISKFRQENRDKYYKDEKMQARERELLSARQRLADRAA
jgi:hypothetical protein